MDFSSLFPRHETASSVRQKADALLAQVENADLHLKPRISSGENRINTAGHEGDFRQFRTYRAEDRPQDIDWKRSARSDDLLIREREKNQRQKINLYFLSSAGMNFKSSSRLMTKHETGAVMATALALWARKNHYLVSLNNQNINADHFADAAINPSHDADFRQAGNSGSVSALTVIIGDFLNELSSFDHFFTSFPPHDVILLQILDPAECDLPFHGRSLFEFGSERSVINNVDAVRADYKAALNQHLNAIRHYTARRNWHYEFARSDDNLHHALSSIFRRIGERA